MAIAKLNAMVGASIAGFTAAMSQGERSIAGFQSSFSNMAGTVSGIAATLGAGVAVAALANLTKHSFDNIDATAKLSDTLGIATESLGRLQYAATYSGTSSESLTGALVKMQKALNKADEDGGKAAATFELLHLATSDLINLPADQQFGKIADALNAIENPAQRNAAAMAIFGKGAASLMPLLAEGSTGLAKFGVEADKLGYSFSRVDAAKVEAANDAIQKMHNVLEGALNALSIKMAPFIEVLANKLSDFAIEGDGLAGTLVSGFGSVVKALGTAADYIDLGKAGFYYLASAALESTALMQQAIAKVIKAVEYLLEKLGKSHSGWADAFADNAKAMESAAVTAFDKAGVSWDNFMSGKHAGEADRLFNGIVSGAQKAAEAMATAKHKAGGMAIEVENNAKAIEKMAGHLADLQKQIRQFGLSDVQKGFDDAIHGDGTFWQKWDAAKMGMVLGALKEGKEEAKAFGESVKQALEGAETPADKFLNKTRDALRFLMAGAVTAEQFGALMNKANVDLAGHQSHEHRGAPSAAAFGSREAADFIAEIDAQQQGRNGEDAKKAQLEEQRKTNIFLARLAQDTAAALVKLMPSGMKF